MVLGSVECKVCGFGMHKQDVRQLALFYSQEQPAVVAVQYVCPRCGALEWQQFDPDECGPEAFDFPFDWATLACELGVAQGEAAAVPTVCAELPRPCVDTELCGGELARPIDLDEYIDFARRVAGLTNTDLRALTDSLL